METDNVGYHISFCFKNLPITTAKINKKTAVRAYGMPLDNSGSRAITKSATLAALWASIAGSSDLVFTEITPKIIPIIAAPMIRTIPPAAACMIPKRSPLNKMAARSGKLLCSRVRISPRKIISSARGETIKRAAT